MESFYPKGNWVKWKSRIEESVESLIKWVFEKTVNKSWQSRWLETKRLAQARQIYKKGRNASLLVIVTLFIYLSWTGEM